MALSRIPVWGRLHWAPRSMRCTILSPNGNPLVEMAPQSAEGRHQFGDWCTLMHAAPDMLAALHAADTALSDIWLSLPDPGLVAAQPFVDAQNAIRAAIAKAEGR